MLVKTVGDRKVKIDAINEGKQYEYEKELKKYC